MDQIDYVWEREGIMNFPRHRFPGAMEWIALISMSGAVLIRDGLPEPSWMLWFCWVPGVAILMMCGLLASLCNLTVAPAYRMPWCNIVIRPFSSWIEWVILMGCSYYLAPEQFHHPDKSERSS
jgi:hypothetical protein